MRAAEGIFLYPLLLAGSVCEAMVIKPALEPTVSLSGREHAGHTGRTDHVAKHRGKQSGKQSGKHPWPQSSKLLQQEWPWSRRPDSDLLPGTAPPSPPSAAAPPSSAASAHHLQRGHDSSKARYHYGHKAAASARASGPRPAPGAAKAPEPQPTPGAAKFSEPQPDFGDGDTASTDFSEPQPGAAKLSEPRPRPDAGARRGRPTHPGCWMKMPSGCPKLPMRTQTWRRDTWAEQRGLDEGGCLRRKRTWDKYCETDDADMLYIPNATVKYREDLSALQIGLGDDWPPAWWPWSKSNDAKAGGAQALEAVHYWVDDGCHAELERMYDDYAGAYVRGTQAEAFARCCSSDGSFCRSPQMCNASQPGTHADAEDACRQEGLRLCTKDELLSEVCCGTGGECDSFPVWTSSVQAPVAAAEKSAEPAAVETALQALEAVEAVHYWVDDGCHAELRTSDDYAGAYVRGTQAEAFARCCSSDGSSCRSPQMCNTSQPGTHADAADACRKQGLRLCTKDELLSEVCCGTGGECDSFPVWTSSVQEDLSALKIGLGDDWPPSWWPWSHGNDAKASGAQAAEAVHYWVDDGCHMDPKVPDDYVGAYVHGAQAEAFARCCSSDGVFCSSPQMCNISQRGTHADAADVCHRQGLRLCTKDELLSDMCCGTGGECDSFPVWTSSVQAAQPASAVAEPTRPGCYMSAPSGCPNHPMTTAWRSDGWADQNNLDEAGCMERKITWDAWCGATDAQMKHVPRPGAESGSALRLNKRQNNAEAARDSHFDELIANPSEPGCYMRIPSGCPKHPMRTQAWRHDTWAEQQDLDEKSCKERKIQWDNYCGSNDAKAFFVPKQ